jgi:uncharacterized membrane protein
MALRIAVIMGVMALSGLLNHADAHDERHVKRSNDHDTTHAVRPAEAGKTGANPPYVKKNEVNNHSFSLVHALVSHMHNKIIHFPIAIGILAMLLSFLDTGRQSDIAMELLLWLGWASALAAGVTGYVQAAAFDGPGTDWILPLHRALGIAVCALYTVWLCVVQRRRNRMLAQITGVVLSVIIILAAFFGGVLAHS